MSFSSDKDILSYKEENKNSFVMLGYGSTMDVHPTYNPSNLTGSLMNKEFLLSWIESDIDYSWVVLF